MLLEGSQNLAHAPVEFFDHITVKALLRFAPELVGSSERDVRIKPVAWSV